MQTCPVCVFYILILPVASLGGRGGPPRVTPFSGHPKIKFVWKFTKNSGETKTDREKGCGVTPSWGWHPSESNKKWPVMRNKRSSVSQEKINRGDTAELAETVMTKKRKKRGRQFFSGKNRGVTPSVAAPGVTHPSDVTEYHIYYV